MYKEYFTLGTRGFLKDLASLRSARALNEATCAHSKVLFVHYRNITPPHYDTRSIVNSYFNTVGVLRKIRLYYAYTAFLLPIYNNPRYAPGI